MDFFQHFYIGAKAVFRSFHFIYTHQLYWYILFPVFLMPLVFLLGNHVLHRPINEEVHNIFEITILALRLLLEISLSMLFMHFAKFIVVILLSPVLTHLSAKTERLITGKSYPFDANQFIKDILRALSIAFRNLFWQYVLILLIVMVSLSFWGSLKQSPIAVLIYVVTAYYYGFSFMDYTIERRKLSINESVEFVRQHRGLAFSIGFVYSLMIFVPVDIEMVFMGKGFQDDGFLVGLGYFLAHIFLFICACAAPILAVVAATIAMHEILPGRKRA
jgi:CysZ protein